MTSQKWRLALSLVLALGIVSALGLAVTNADAAAEPQIKNAPATDNWGGCWYVVRHGDTLFSIGMRYGVSPYYLAQINGLYNPNLIYAGMKLTVPCDQHQPKPPRPPKPPPLCEVKYVVKPGDNLFRLALNHGSTINAIRDANHLWGKALRPGRTLTIPVYEEEQEAVAPAEGGAGKGELPEDQNCPPNGQLPEKEAPVREQTPSDQMQATPIPPIEPAQPTDGGQQNPQPTAEGQAQGLPPEPSGSILLTATAVDPASATISAGQSVLWINNSDNVYTIVSGSPGQPNEMFTSGELPPGATWVHTFDAAGTYSYFINENPTLVGQVTVNP